MSFSVNSFSLEAKVALVTGGAYGIGFAIARAFAAAGAKIAFNCRGKEQIISQDGAPVIVMVIPTNEELMIAQDTMELVLDQE